MKLIYLAIGIFILLIGMGYISLDFLGTGSVFESGPFPHYSYSLTASRCSCVPTSAYDKVLGDYSTKINVLYVSNGEQARALYDNDKFTWDIGLRCSSEVYGNVYEGEGVPSQIKCDGSKDCNFGYTTEQWELRSDGKCYVKSLYYVPDPEPDIFVVPDVPSPALSWFQQFINQIINFFRSLFK